MRKRDDLSPKTVLGILNIILIALAVGMISLFLLVAKRPDKSMVEQRLLKEFPEFNAENVLSGTFSADLLEHYTDTVPGRDKLKSIAASIMECAGLRIGNAKIHGGSERPTTDTEKEDEWWNTTAPITQAPDTKPPVTDAPGPVEPDDTTDAPDTDEPVVTDPPETTKAPETQPPEDMPDGNDAAINNGILVYGNRGMALYGGSYNYAKGYIATLANYRASLDPSVRIYSMTIPTAVAFYLPKGYEDQTADQHRDLEYLKSLFDYNNATYVDVYGALAPHVSEPIYSRTDHHWAPRGAFYAAQQLAKDAGVPFKDDLENDFDAVTIPGYVGTLYGYTQDVALLNNPEDFIYYKPRNSYTTNYYSTANVFSYTGSLFFNVSGSQCYCSFLGTDNIIVQIQTDCHNGRKLMIIKDSFGNALVPFLTNSFEEIYVTDLRYFEPNAIQFINENGITDVVFALCMQDVFGGWMKNLEKIRVQ